MFVIQCVSYFFTIFNLLIFIRIIASWIPELARFRFMYFVYSFTEPYMNFFRRVIPPLGMIDISPIVAIFSLSLIENYVVMPFIIRIFYG